MKIALIGAGGYVGSALRAEALARGHHVRALVANPAKLAPIANLEVNKVDVLDTDTLASLLNGCDVIISAFSGHAQSDVRGYYDRGIRSVIAASKRVGKRLLVVGGAGSLDIAPGKQLVDSPEFPAEWKDSAEGARDALNLLRGEPDLDWTMLSPSAVLEPGPRTDKFRLGGDSLLVGSDGTSRISTGDYAAAMLDEAEHPQHRRARFTVGY